MLEDMENNGLEYHSGWDCCVPQIFLDLRSIL